MKFGTASVIKILVLFCTISLSYGVPPVILNINYHTFSYTDKNPITLDITTDQTNLSVSVNVFALSNSDTPISFVSNFYAAELNFFISNISLSAADNTTNWIEITAVNDAPETNALSRIGIVFSTPKIFFWKSNFVKAPVSSGYKGSASNPVPGSALIYTLIFSNSGAVPVKYARFQEVISSNSTGIISSSITGAHIVNFISGGNENYIPTPFDYNVSAVYFIRTNIAPGETGSIQYVLVIK